MQSSEATKRIALAVKSKRRRAGLGVRAAAQECGVSASTISRLERGAGTNLPDADTLAKIASWVGVPVTQFLDDNLGPSKSEIQITTPEVVEVDRKSGV